MDRSAERDGGVVGRPWGGRVERSRTDVQLRRGDGWGGAWGEEENMARRGGVWGEGGGQGAGFSRSVG